VADALYRSRHRNTAHPGRGAAPQISDDRPSPRDWLESSPDTEAASVADDVRKPEASFHSYKLGRSGPPRLSIVILPFANVGVGPDQEYFVDGVTESLTTDLSRIPGAFVIPKIQPWPTRESR
jgi:hypothetical protein